MPEQGADTAAEGATAAVGTADVRAREVGAGARTRRPRWQRLLRGLLLVLLVVAVLGVLLYSFGGMMPPSDQARAQYAMLQSQGAVGPVQERLHIPIPGCVCHSDNPILQMEHSNRSLSQCGSCHGGSAAASASR